MAIYKSLKWHENGEEEQLEKNLRLRMRRNSYHAAAKSLQCLTVQPHRRQPTKLPHPWDFPSKNTAVGYHFLLQCMMVKNESEVSDSKLPHGLQPTRLLRPWDFPGKGTGVGCHCLPQIATMIACIYWLLIICQALRILHALTHLVFTKPWAVLSPFYRYINWDKEK